MASYQVGRFAARGSQAYYRGRYVNFAGVVVRHFQGEPDNKHFLVEAEFESGSIASGLALSREDAERLIRELQAQLEKQ